MFSEAFEALTAPASADELARALAEVCKLSGGDRFIFIQLRGFSDHSILSVAHNGSADAESRMRPDDPALVRLVHAFGGFGPPIALTPDCETALDVDGYAFGVAAIARAEWGGCIVVFACGETAPAADELLAMMSGAQLAVQCALGGLPRTVEGPLSQRELDCLRYYMAGKDPRQTAQALGISARTVEGHLARVRLRLSADNTLAAAIYALKAGWIFPSEIRDIEFAA